MNGNPNDYQKRGGTKEYKADPIKQFLISRGTARDRAVELCIAGKITLKQIPDYTDRLTVIHFAGLAVDPAVDAVMLKISARCVKREADRQAAKTPMDHFAEEHPIEEDGLDPNASDAECMDQQAEFDVDRERELYEQEQAEEAGKQKVESTTSGEAYTPLKCTVCGKNYKTEKGRTNHMAKEHGQERDADYGDHR